MALLSAAEVLIEMVLPVSVSEGLRSAVMGLFFHNHSDALFCSDIDYHSKTLL